jgi:hypothetical protein
MGLGNAFLRAIRHSTRAVRPLILSLLSLSLLFSLWVDSLSSQFDSRLEMGSPFCSIQVGSSKSFVWIRSERLCRGVHHDFTNWKTTVSRKAIPFELAFGGKIGIYSEDGRISGVPATEIHIGYAYIVGIVILTTCACLRLHSRHAEKRSIGVEN